MLLPMVLVATATAAVVASDTATVAQPSDAQRHFARHYLRPCPTEFVATYNVPFHGALRDINIGAPTRWGVCDGLGGLDLSPRAVATLIEGDQLVTEPSPAVNVALQAAFEVGVLTVATGGATALFGGIGGGEKGETLAAAGGIAALGGIVLGGASLLVQALITDEDSVSDPEIDAYNASIARGVGLDGPTWARWARSSTATSAEMAALDHIRSDVDSRVLRPITAAGYTPAYIYHSGSGEQLSTGVPLRTRGVRRGNEGIFMSDGDLYEVLGNEARSPTHSASPLAMGSFMALFACVGTFVGVIASALNDDVPAEATLGIGAGAIAFGGLGMTLIDIASVDGDAEQARLRRVLRAYNERILETALGQ